MRAIRLIAFFLLIPVWLPGISILAWVFEVPNWRRLSIGQICAHLGAGCISRDEP